MKPRILSIGVDTYLLRTREALLASKGYDTLTATPQDVEDKLGSGPLIS